jgi:hypothetical protein
LPGSVESGALLLPKARVPPLAEDGLTTLVIAALKPGDDDEVLPPLLLEPLLLQAASARAADRPSAASPNVLRLRISETPPYSSSC